MNIRRGTHSLELQDRSVEGDADAWGWRGHAISPTLLSSPFLSITSQIYTRECDFDDNPGMLNSTSSLVSFVLKLIKNIQ